MEKPKEPRFHGETTEKSSRTMSKIRGKDKAAKLSVYVYTIGGSVAGYENEFDDLTNIELKPIPEPILDIYKSVNGD